MNFQLSVFALSCAALLAAAPVAQAQQGGATPRLGASTSQGRSSSAAQAGAPRRGITDIMREGPATSTLPPPVAAAAQPQGQRAAEYIVALVNSEPITNTQVQKRVERILREAGPEAQRIPREQISRQVLDQIISERAQLQLAKELDLRVDAMAIDQAEEVVARQNQVSLSELRRRVGEAGISRDEFRNNLRDQLLLTRLRERELEGRVKVSDDEIDQFLRDQRAAASSAAPDINLAQVLITVPERATAAQVAEAQKRAEDIARRARAGEDFAQLAVQLSDAPDAKGTGGALGLRAADRYPPLFVEATQSTPVGGIVGPVRSGAGFHVLKVLARQNAASPDSVVTQTQVRHILMRPDSRRTPEQIVSLMTDFKRRVQAGTADFAALARENSQDTVSARAGGELGWSTPGQFVPEFEEAMSRLQPGQISDPIVSRFGIHLIQVEGRRDAKLSPAELREAARNVLRDRKMEDAYEAWAQEVRQRAYVEMREAPAS